VRILVAGAGVIGSVYGGKLLQAGHEVVMLARGERLVDLQREGLVLEEAGSGQRIVLPVGVVASTGPEDRYDLVMAPLQRDQMPGILPMLSDLRRSPDVLFFGNAVGLTASLNQALGRPAMFGFPGAGGIRDGAVIRYVLIPRQKTMLGAPDDRASTRARHLQAVFGEAGLPTTISGNVEEWLTAHCAFIVPIAFALYRCDTDASRLADDPSGLLLMVRASRQAFRALRATGNAEVPMNLRVLYLRMPSAFAVGYWRRVLAGPRGELWFAGHSRAAREEMTSLAAQLLATVHRTGRPSRDLDALLGKPPPPTP
jgi:2-dehydropantoate 2-reductase